MVHPANHIVRKEPLDANKFGICYKKGKTTIQSLPYYEALDKELLPDFSDLEFSDYLNYETKTKEKVNDGVLVIPYRTSFGCVNACTFCDKRLSEKLGVKSIDKVVSDLIKLKQQYKKNIYQVC